MLLLPAILLVALGLGYAFGGRLRSLGAIRIRLWWLAFVGLALQVAPIPQTKAIEELPAIAFGLSYALLLIVAAANLRQPGFLLVLVGVAMNLAVIAANRGMPVSEPALRTAGGAGDIAQLRSARGEKHHLERHDDVLLPFADVIGIPKPIGAVVSVGDLIAYSGAGWFLIATMRRGPRPQDWTEGARARRATRSGTRR